MAHARDGFAKQTQQNAETPQAWGYKLVTHCFKPKASAKTACEMMAKADLTQTDSFGQTALMGCASHNYHEIAKTLIARKVDLDVQTTRGTSALTWGTRHNANETVLAIIAGGASLDLQEEKGQTALHIAASAGNPVLTAALIKAGANIDARDHHGRTPLFEIAASGYAEEGILLCAKLLLEAGADLDIPDQTDILAETKVKTNVLSGTDQMRYPRIAALFQEHRIEQLRRIGDKSMHISQPLTVPKLCRKAGRGQPKL